MSTKAIRYPSSNAVPLICIQHVSSFFISWGRPSEHHKDGGHQADCRGSAVGGGPAPLSDWQGGGRLHLSQSLQGTYICPADLFLQTLCTTTEYEGCMFVPGGFSDLHKHMAR